MLPARDSELVTIVDRALARAMDLGGARMACRPGCTPCCHGVFRVSALDAARLHQALADLAREDGARAAAIRTRARELVTELAPFFPGDTATGWLLPEDSPEHAAAWEHFADLPAADRACPVLDPGTGRCELYAGRPLTCRIFGPPVRNEGGIGFCELCYQDATEEQILAGEMKLDHAPLEAELDCELARSGMSGETVIAWALRDNL